MTFVGLVNKFFLVTGLLFLIISSNYSLAQPMPDANSKPLPQTQSATSTQTNKRYKIIIAPRDSIKLDSLSIIPDTWVLEKKQNGHTVGVDTSDYKIDFAKSILYLNPTIVNDSLTASFRVYPFAWPMSLAHKSRKDIGSFVNRQMQPVVIGQDGELNTFQFPGLTYNGSLARGISIGNNQDLFVNSNFNLQITGKLSNDIEILGSLQDSNIPFQAEGNTQQLQEFDRIFIQVKKDSTKLLLGDYDLPNPNTYFLQYQRRLQGANISTAIGQNWQLGGSVAVARGQYVRNSFNGQEGNQGPYRLKGINGELYLIILSGSERVFIDGVKLTRGYDFDYTIDYNLGEISFTNKRIITKDHRIVVEFEYSDKNYLRTTLASHTKYTHKKLKSAIMVFAEQDSKNQPILQSLTDDDKAILTAVGDSIQLAVRPGVDSIGYIENRVLYRKTDTLIYNQYYPEVYVFSNNPELAIYSLSFSYVGEGNGHYVLDNSNANGRIYKWLANDSTTALKRGAYEPVIQLIAPIKRQMLSWTSEMELNKSHKVYTEIAMSKKDVNSFSNINNKDDIGFGIRTGYDTKWQLSEKQKWILQSQNQIAWMQDRFRSIEPIRQVEFNRDWNITDGVQRTERQLITNWTASKDNKLTVNTGLQWLQRVGVSKSWQPKIKVSYIENNWNIKSELSYLKSKTSDHKTDFIRPSMNATRWIAKKYAIGINSFLEHNNTRVIDIDSLLTQSFYFHQNEITLAKADTCNYWYKAAYKRRYNYVPVIDRFARNDVADEFNWGMGLNTKGLNQFYWDATFRRLDVLRPSATLKDNNNFVTLIRHQLLMGSGALSVNTVYKANAGQERKVEYIYIPTINNTGAYFWEDANEDGIQQDEEFYLVNDNTVTEINRFDRQLVTTDQYIKTTLANISQSISLSPKAIWSNKKNMLKWVSYLASETNIEFTQNLLGDSTRRLPNLNPFYYRDRDSLVSNQASLRSTLFINRGSPKISADFQYLYINEQRQLISGAQGQNRRDYKAHGRYNLNSKLHLAFYSGWAIQSAFSQAYENNNYKLKYQLYEPHISWVQSNKMRIELYYRMKRSLRLDSLVTPAMDHKFTLEFKKSMLTKSSFQVKTSLAKINYDWPVNPQLEFVVLEGLKEGLNYIWELVYEKRFANNLQLYISYSGRKNNNSRLQQTAKAELRAVF